jgi:hypothetical protein
MFRLGIVGILITAILGYLGHTFIKYWIGKLFHRKPDNVFETVRLILIPIAVGIALYVLFQTQKARESAEDRQHDSQAKLETLEERESLRPWVMITPTGMRTMDRMGLNSTGGGSLEERHKKIFTQEGLSFSFGGPIKCADAEYIKGIRELIRYYLKLPYAYVALTWCLKERGDSSWEEIGEKARNLLEKLIVINPCVIYRYFLWNADACSL